MIPDHPYTFAFFLACAVGCGSPQTQDPKTTPATPPTAEPMAEPTAEPTADLAGSTQPPAESPSKDIPGTLFIHDRTVACQGEGPMRCMQVRTSETSEWEWFYGKIEGFDYEEGNRYELRVEIINVDHPAADGASKKYRLLQVVSKARGEQRGAGGTTEPRTGE